MCTDEKLVSAATRVLAAYEAGASPLLEDLWAIELSVSASNAPDLLLGYAELARKILQLHQPLCVPIRAPLTRAAGAGPGGTGPASE